MQLHSMLNIHVNVNVREIPRKIIFRLCILRDRCVWFIVIGFYHACMSHPFIQIPIMVKSNFGILKPSYSKFNWSNLLHSRFYLFYRTFFQPPNNFFLFIYLPLQKRHSGPKVSKLITLPKKYEVFDNLCWQRTRALTVPCRLHCGYLRLIL